MADENAKRRSILVTGGSTGLGLAPAKAFAATGDRVFICARTASDLEKVAEATPSIIGIQADVTRADDRVRLWKTIASCGAHIDTLVNNAAISRAHDYTNAFTLESDRARD